MNTALQESKYPKLPVALVVVWIIVQSEIRTLEQTSLTGSQSVSFTALELYNFGRISDYSSGKKYKGKEFPFTNDWSYKMRYIVTVIGSKRTRFNFSRVVLIERCEPRGKTKLPPWRPVVIRDVRLGLKLNQMRSSTAAGVNQSQGTYQHKRNRQKEYQVHCNFLLNLLMHIKF